ncbi:MAG: PD-(D/E)XK nuclease family protein [Planctomycetes bacterium]|nr:PD-(D/E)XK nuclease family protein [Planctomycetota bacterium]
MACDGPFSHSRLESFRQCPRKFRLRYIDAIPARRRGIEAFMGSRVHEALEWLYRKLGAGQPVACPELLRYFHRRWDESYGDDVERVRENRGPDHYRAAGVACLETYYRLNHPFADAARTLGLEQRVEFELDGDARYPIQGYIDRLVQGADGMLEIHDYKTSSRMPRPEDFAADGQLALYQIGLGRVFAGQRGVRLVWHYLVHGERVELGKTPADLERLGARTRATIDAVRAEQAWEARPGALCRWCDYHDLCPEGSRVVEGAQSVPWNEGRLVWRYAGVKRAAGEPGGNPAALRREAELLRSALRDYVVRTGRSVLTGGPGRLVVQPPTETAPPRWVMRFEPGDPGGDPG